MKKKKGRTMKVRKLIEMLAKQNWDAEVLMQIGLSAHPADKILSISSFTKKGKPIVTLNVFKITPNKKLYAGRKENWNEKHKTKQHMVRSSDNNVSADGCELNLHLTKITQYGDNTLITQIKNG